MHSLPSVSNIKQLSSTMLHGEHYVSFVEKQKQRAQPIVAPIIQWLLDDRSLIGSGGSVTVSG